MPSSATRRSAYCGVISSEGFIPVRVPLTAFGGVRLGRIQLVPLNPRRDRSHRPIPDSHTNVERYRLILFEGAWDGDVVLPSCLAWTVLVERGFKRMTRIVARRTLLTGAALTVAAVLIVGCSAQDSSSSASAQATSPASAVQSPTASPDAGATSSAGFSSTAPGASTGQSTSSAPTSATGFKLVPMQTATGGEFVSPSGNISCQVSLTEALCQTGTPAQSVTMSGIGSVHDLHRPAMPQQRGGRHAHPRLRNGDRRRPVPLRIGHHRRHLHHHKRQGLSDFQLRHHIRVGLTPAGRPPNVARQGL